MDVRILDLDGGPASQASLTRFQPAIHDLWRWGPRLRLACRFGRFRAFEQELAAHSGSLADVTPYATLYGSGDFHHVSLALVRRLREPFNLLVIDNHPDWMHSVPVLHCGTWVWHAAQLPLLHTVYHVGGEVDFDNYYRWLAPWSFLRSGKIRVFPAFRRLTRGAWSSVPNDCVRSNRSEPTTAERLAQLLEPHRTDLASRPLYISLDKDVMPASEAVVNWDSGHLSFADVRLVVEAFRTAAHGRLLGFDTTGDRSPVQVQGWLRKFLHLTEHPALPPEPNSDDRNGALNAVLLDLVGVDGSWRSRVAG
jgi:hypothetical protein